jgi:hypothetical protein
MPYKIKGKCIYKKDTDKKVGCTTGSVKKYMKALHANVKESLDEIPAGPEEEPSEGDMVGEHYRFDQIVEEEGMQKAIYKCTSSNAHLVLNYQAGEYVSGEIKFEDPSGIPSAEDVEMAGQDAMHRMDNSVPVKESQLSFNELYHELLD